MKLLLIAVIVVAVAGCPSATVREREASAIAQMTFGGPLVLGGAGSLAGAGIVAISAAQLPKNPRDGALTTAALLGATGVAELALGLFLLIDGGGRYIDAVPAADPEDARTLERQRKRQRERERDAEEMRERLRKAREKEDLRDGWDPPGGG